MEVVFAGDPDNRDIALSETVPNTLYMDNDNLYSVIAGSKSAGYFIVIHFPTSKYSSFSSMMIKTTGVIGLAGIIISILFGIYITGQAKKEIENLITASDRISAGDYKTPVMAYEEGDFSRLADAFTEMMLNIRKTQNQLAMSEKIAAWQDIGKKIAHEIKNPLTPIRISAEDLRRSHQEGLPNFEQTLESSTSVIIEETERLRKLLNNFVEFARMTSPEIKDILINEVISNISALYHKDISTGNLVINPCNIDKPLKIDPDKIKQLIINLINNGLEAENVSCVTLDTKLDNENLIISINDNGNGFSKEMLSEGIRPHVSTKKGGSGLGLVICQRIAYDHGGSLEVNNSDDGGGVATAIIPI